MHLWAGDELCMESQCRMIVSIRFAILHLFLYASLYPPASVLSGWGRLTRVSGSSLPLALTLQSIWNGCPGGGERGGGIQRAKVWFLKILGACISVFSLIKNGDARHFFGGVLCLLKIKYKNIIVSFFF